MTMLGDVGAIPFLPLAPVDLKEWRTEKKIAIVPEGPSFYRREIVDEQAWEAVPDAARGYEENRLNIVEDNDRQAYIVRLFKIFSEEKFPSKLGGMRPKLLVEGSQNIYFDKIKGIVTEANAKGKFQYAETVPLDFECKFKLLDDDLAGKVYKELEKKLRFRKSRKSIREIFPSQKLTLELRDEIVGQLNAAKDPSEMYDGLALLATFYPNSDEEISAVLANNFVKFYEVRTDRLFLHWILPKHVPAVLESFSSLDANEADDYSKMENCIVDLLESHPRLTDSNGKLVEAVLKTRFDPQIRRILARQYPDMIERILLPRLGSNWVDVQLVEFLGKHGSEETLNVLRRLRSRPEMVPDQAQAVDAAIKQIEARN